MGGGGQKIEGLGHLCQLCTLRQVERGIKILLIFLYIVSLIVV